MSLIEKGRVLAKKALDKHGIDTIVTRAAPADVRPKADRAAGIMRAGAGVLTFEGKGILGSRKVRLADGTRTVESTITTDIPLKANDKVKLGSLEYTVTIVEEKNPAGEPTAIIYIAGLK